VAPWEGMWKPPDRKTFESRTDDRRSRCVFHLGCHSRFGMNFGFVNCFVSLTILSRPPLESGSIPLKSKDSARVRDLHTIYSFGRRVCNTSWADMGDEDRMILWLFSMVGVIVGVLATGTSISDSEALILLGIAFIGIAVRLRRGKGMRH
jgi:hypothetical protein